jgi:hypothetical protein
MDVEYKTLGLDRISVQKVELRDELRCRSIGMQSGHQPALYSCSKERLCKNACCMTFKSLWNPTFLHHDAGFRVPIRGLLVKIRVFGSRDAFAAMATGR